MSYHKPSQRRTAPIAGAVGFDTTFAMPTPYTDGMLNAEGVNMSEQASFGWAGMLVYCVFGSWLFSFVILVANANGGAIGLGFIALVSGLAYYAAMGFTARITGDALVPGITIVNVLLGYQPWLMGLFYLICQLLGSLLAVLVFWSFDLNPAASGLGAPVIAPGVTTGSAFLALMWSSMFFAMVYVYLKMQHALNKKYRGIPDMDGRDELGQSVNGAVTMGTTTCKIDRVQISRNDELNAMFGAMWDSVVSTPLMVGMAMAASSLCAGFYVGVSGFSYWPYLWAALISGTQSAPALWIHALAPIVGPLIVAFFAWLHRMYNESMLDGNPLLTGRRMAQA